MLIFVRCVGVAIALAGAIFAAGPGAFRVNLSGSKRGATEVARRLLHRTRDVHGTAAFVGGGLLMAARGYVTSEGSLEERLATLERTVKSLHSEVGDVAKRVADEATAREREIERLDREIQALRQEIESHRRSGAQVDAAALPSVGVGIVLLGLPDRYMDHLWIEILSLVVAAAVVVLYVLLRFDPQRPR